MTTQYFLAIVSLTSTNISIFNPLHPLKNFAQLFFLNILFQIFYFYFLPFQPFKIKMIERILKQFHILI